MKSIDIFKIKIQSVLGRSPYVIAEHELESYQERFRPRIIFFFIYVGYNQHNLRYHLKVQNIPIYNVWYSANNIQLQQNSLSLST